MATVNENKLLREKYYMIAKTYLDLGVDGFRLDAISHLAKDTEYNVTVELIL